MWGIQRKSTDNAGFSTERKLELLRRGLDRRSGSETFDATASSDTPTIAAALGIESSGHAIDNSMHDSRANSLSGDLGRG
jgi:hypothetical protein